MKKQSFLKVVPKSGPKSGPFLVNFALFSFQNPIQIPGLEHFLSKPRKPWKTVFLVKLWHFVQKPYLIPGAFDRNDTFDTTGTETDTTLGHHCSECAKPLSNPRGKVQNCQFFSEKGVKKCISQSIRSVGDILAKSVKIGHFPGFSIKFSHFPKILGKTWYL